jgi:hypothetical protein
MSEVQIDLSAGEGKQAEIRFSLSGWGLLWMREHVPRRFDERLLQWMLWPLPFFLLRWIDALIRPLRVFDEADWHWTPIKRVYFSAEKSVSIEAKFGSTIEVRGLSLLGGFCRQVEVPVPDEQVPQLDRAALNFQLSKSLRPQLNTLLGISQHEGVQISSQLSPVLHSSHPWSEAARFHPLIKLPKIKIKTGEMPATAILPTQTITQLHEEK